MYRLLIADDEVIERMVLHKTLTKQFGDRCKIFRAENGREALEIYEREQIQIAILDIEMPGINGIEAAEKIREQDKNCCIIFLTAFDEFSYAKKAIGVRALDYLLKPYGEEELFFVLEEAMRLVDKRPEVDRMADEPMTQEGEENGNLIHSKVAEAIEQYICDHYMQDISMQDAAKMMNYSEAYFCKLFKQCFQKNFTTFLTEYRVEQAKKLLESPTVNVKEVGKQVGYPDSNYFAKVFKRVTGSSPSEYRLCIFQRES
ncbi:MAG: response regulator [Lachnospiraceae bacterium]